MTDPDHADFRPTLADGTPVVTMEQRLLIEVERAQERLDAALEDLRRWRLRNA